MQQIVEFFKGLFATDSWPPRWHCGNWTSFHGWLYILSDLTIWVAYFLIPLIIIDYLGRKKNGIKFQKVYLLFAAFMILRQVCLKHAGSIAHPFLGVAVCQRCLDRIHE